MKRLEDCMKLIDTEEELTPKEAIKRALLLVNPKVGIIKYIFKSSRFNDEPNIPSFNAKMCNTKIFCDSHGVEEFCGGTSLDENIAKLKTLGESIERYCLSIYWKKDFIQRPFAEFENKAIDPSFIVNFSSSQKLMMPKEFSFDRNSIFNWTKGYSITSKKKIYIPSQIIFVPYHENEPIIRFPISTGAASGTSLKGAIIRGILEVVERDAFMINYLNRLPRLQLDIKKINDNYITKILEYSKRYNIGVHVFDITTDIPIPTFMSILVDKTGFGPAISVGLKSSMDYINGIKGSIEEAFHSRPWIREEMIKLNFKINVHEPICGLKERGLLWSQTKMIRHLDFILNNKKEIRPIKSIDGRNNLNCIISELEHRGMEIIFVDITTEDIKSVGFKVVKVIIPQMHPLFLDERFKYLGGKRLYEVPKLLGYTKNYTNEDSLFKIPHPFL